MIRLGICTGVQNAAAMKEMGYDYFELSMSAVAAMTDAEFEQLRTDCAASGLVCESMNGMLPGTLKLTGEVIDEAAIRAYLDLAYSRAQQLGTQVVVFGSGAARAVPEGFPYDEAWRQIVAFLKIVDEYAGKYGLTVAIEPLRAAECNIINYVSEATILTALSGTRHIRVLGDYYHMAVGHEPVEALVRAGDKLAHIHIARPEGRIYPYEGDGEDYAPLFDALKRAGYNGRVSVEGGCTDFLPEAKASFALLDQLRRA